MRRIGSLPNESDANRFCDYLQTQSIDAKPSSSDESAPPASTAHDIWIRSEHDVPRSKELLAEFQANPQLPEYDVSEQAERLRIQRSAEIAEKIAAQKKSQMQLRRGGFSGSSRGIGALGGGQSPATIPVTIGLIVAATVIGFITNFALFTPMDYASMDPTISPQGPTTAMRVFNALACVDYPAYFASGEDALVSIKNGEVWRLFTPILLHGSMMHLAFNMINLFVLGSVVERLHGHLMYAAIILISGGIGTLSQIVLAGLIGGPFGGALAIGASGAVFGVFGFMWIRPKIEANYPVEIPSFNVKFMLGFLVLCFTPLIPNIANGAHLGGLIAGMILARFLPARG